MGKKRQEKYQKRKAAAKRAMKEQKKKKHTELALKQAIKKKKAEKRLKAARAQRARRAAALAGLVRLPPRRSAPARTEWSVAAQAGAPGPTAQLTPSHGTPTARVLALPGQPGSAVSS